LVGLVIRVEAALWAFALSRLALYRAAILALILSGLALYRALAAAFQQALQHDLRPSADILLL
jgi:hypothetical protein